MSPDTLFRPNVPSYSSILDSIDKQLEISLCHETDCESYPEDFAATVESPVGNATEFDLLPNAESFVKRRDLFLKAKKSIFVLVWAVYNDQTGFEFRDQLLNALKRNPDLDIRIVVDGNIVNMKGKRTLKEMEKLSRGKIKVMRWKSRRYRANGNHRKLIIVDSEHVIVGGINVGNNYSHMATEDKWRDLDIYIRGRMAAQNAENQFISVWNKQIVEFPKLKNQLGVMKEAEVAPLNNGSPVVFVDQHPGSAVKDSYHNIHTAIVKLFRDAKESIDIENAYFIMDPIIKKELHDVIKRGVKVRIFTNSDKSVDEPIVSMPIMHSAREAVMMGARVWLRQGSTLHSKFMVVDDRISMVGSFNFHPRSLRFDAENVAVIFNEKVAKSLTRHMDEAMANEAYIDNPKQLKIKWDFMSFLTQSFYFDFL